jgi:peroxiredoxin
VDLYNKYHSAGLEVCLISDEPVEQLRAFAQGTQIPMSVLSDQKRVVFDDYGVSSIPYTLLIDRRGKVAYVMPGFAPSGFAEEFAPKIEQLLKGQ